MEKLKQLCLSAKELGSEKITLEFNDMDFIHLQNDIFKSILDNNGHIETEVMKKINDEWGYDTVVMKIYGVTVKLKVTKQFNPLTGTFDDIPKSKLDEI